MRKTTILVDGEEYASVEAMPPEVRRVYEETIGSLREIGGKRTGGSHVVRTPDGVFIHSQDTKVTVGGETFDLAELPPELRQVVERQLAGAGLDPAAAGAQPQKEVRSHTVRIVRESRFGDSLPVSNWARYPRWVSLLLVALGAAIFVLIALAS